MKQGILLIAILMGWLIACINGGPPPTATPAPSPVPTSTSQPPTSTSQPPTSIPQPTSTPAPTKPPIPTHTPAPIDRVVVNGDWTYFGAACPDIYLNCAPEPSDIDMISLDAQEYRPLSDDSPSIVVMCVPDRPAFAFRSNTHLDSESMAVTLNGTVFWSSDISERDWIWFQRSSNIVRLVQEAEQAQQSLEIAVGYTPEEDMIVGEFNPVGFTTNFNRLSCVN